MKNVQHKKAVVWQIARRRFNHLVHYHTEDVKSIADCADFLFPGPRVQYKEFARIISRKLYHLSKDLGWVRQQTWVRREIPCVNPGEEDNDM